MEASNGVNNPQKKILVVEDDIDLQNALVDRLNAEHFYDVLKASDGEEAITVVVDKRPELILLDMLLPKVDGFGVLSRVRDYPEPDIAATKVIVFSNLWTEKDIMKAKDLSIEEYYVKANTSLEDVVHRINHMFRPDKQA